MERSFLKRNYISALSELVFIERKHIFTHADVELYHPGHFPELNRYILDLYQSEGFKKVMIPSIHNPFLNANEYETHKAILVEYGIPEEKIVPIVGEQHSARDVVRNAMSCLMPDETKVLLAGKAFFCRRFLLLASLYAQSDVLLDVYPMEDERGINRHTWHESEQGIQRVLNEVRQYAAIVEE
jgi:hypothetical protein